MSRKEAYERIQHLVPDHVLLDIRRGKSPVEAWALSRGIDNPWAYASATGAEGAEAEAKAARWSKHAPASTASGASLPPLSFLLEVSYVLDVPVEFLIEDFYVEVFGVKRGG